MPFAMVADGFSEPNSSIQPQRFFHGLSLGQLVVAEIQETFGAACPEDDLETVLLKANQRVLMREESLGIPREIARIAGATIAAVKIGKGLTEIIVTGDAFALVIFNSGNALLTENQVKDHDTEMHEIIARLMRDVAQEMGIQNPTEQELMPIRKEMWNRFCPILREARGRAINADVPGGYGAINGDPRSAQFWKHYYFVTSRIQSMVIFTDGLVNWKMLETTAHNQIANLLRRLYLRGGLSEILNETWHADLPEARRMHITHAEATAIPFDELHLLRRENS